MAKATSGLIEIKDRRADQSSTSKDKTMIGNGVHR
jgi:hypothetical protein